MRDGLVKLEDQRFKFKATVDGFGVKNYKQHETTTICLINIVRNGKLVTDHIWVNLTKGFEKLKLKIGDFIQFEARVKGYWKGYYHDERDLKLSHPSKILKLSQKYIINEDD